MWFIDVEGIFFFNWPLKIFWTKSLYIFCHLKKFQSNYNGICYLTNLGGTLKNTIYLGNFARRWCMSDCLSSDISSWFLFFACSFLKIWNGPWITITHGGYPKKHWKCDHAHTRQGEGGGLTDFFCNATNLAFVSRKIQDQLCVHSKLKISYKFQHIEACKHCLSPVVLGVQFGPI